MSVVDLSTVSLGGNAGATLGGASAALRRAAIAWATTALAGQLAFATYIALYFGRTALAGRWLAWNRTLAVGVVAGDGFGNAVLAAHLAAAVLLMLCGLVQLVPAVRRHWPAWHRISGRVFLVGAITGAGGGLYMTATRPVIGDTAQHLLVSLNGVLILLAATLAWRYARAGSYADHRRWALRTWLLVNGVWFFRIGLMLWLVVNRGPVGFDPKTFTGPFILALSAAQFLLPLALLELYFRAEHSRSPALKMSAALVLALATLLTAAGSAAAAALMWLPRL